MSIQPRLFSADTSALIDGLERYYPEEAFPALWENVDQLIAMGRFFISEEVWEEVKTKDAVVQAWAKPRKDTLIIKTDAHIAIEVKRILTRYSRLVMNLKGRNRADPFVIAVAKLRAATVVTGEGSNGTENRPKIPYICQELGIPCIRLLDVIRLEGWKF